jgi:hypothetical protein
MDGFHGNFLDRIAAAQASDDWHDEDEIDAELHVVIAQDDRRMQVRAYNHWAGLLGDRALPAIGDLRLDQIPDFAPYAVVIDFSNGADHPTVAFVGDKLAAECDTTRTIHRLTDAPGQSLLARMTDHYAQIHRNQAPIGFEAECVNQRQATILYRGILLPFANAIGDGAISHVLGVISWKELADADLTADLARQIGAAFEAAGSKRPLAPLTRAPQWAAWADGPATTADGPTLDAAIALPAPDFGADPRAAAVTALGTLEFSAVPGQLARHMTLADWLASARELAQTAVFSGERTRQALYAAIGRAYDFALAAHKEPSVLAALIADSGLTAQPRAPLIPLVKLVFGPDYDKTRLTEYAAVLTHAQRLGLRRGELAAHLATAPGGLKGIVAEERRWRHADTAVSPRDTRPVAIRQLDALPPRALSTLPPEGAEFTLFVARRLPDGTVALLGEIGDDAGLLARAARHLTS